MNYKIACCHSLVPGLLDRKRKPLGSTILSQGDLSISKGSNNTAFGFYWPKFLSQEKAATFNGPVLWNGAKILNAFVFDPRP